MDQKLVETLAKQLAANVFCPTGQGGGVDPSCSPSGSGGGGGSSLPSNPAKLTIRQAHGALKAKGYTMGRGSHNLKTRKTTYTLRNDKTGEQREVGTDEIKAMLYGKASKTPDVRGLKEARSKADQNLRVLREAKLAQDARVRMLKDKLKASRRRKTD